MKNNNLKQTRFHSLLCILTMSFMLSGCFASSATHDETDPLEGFNRPVFEFNEGLDRNLMKPIAKGYVAITPRPVRKGITNFFDNLSYLNVIFNDVLQGKFKQAAGDSTRFVLNSTLGMLGFFDPATDLGLEKHNEDLGQSLAVWGAGEGAYLNLPLLGPNSVRHSPDLITSAALNPLTYFAAAVTWPATAVNLVNKRANLLDATQFRDDAALDKYTFTREAYRQHRTSLIYDGNPPVEDMEDFFDDEEEDGEEDILLIE